MQIQDMAWTGEKDLLSDIAITVSEVALQPYLYDHSFVLGWVGCQHESIIALTL